MKNGLYRIKLHNTEHEHLSKNDLWGSIRAAIVIVRIPGSIQSVLSKLTINESKLDFYGCEFLGFTDAPVGVILEDWLE